jgi:hypothetical protein
MELSSTGSIGIGSLYYSLESNQLSERKQVSMLKYKMQASKSTVKLRPVAIKLNS